MISYRKVLPYTVFVILTAIPQESRCLRCWKCAAESDTELCWSGGILNHDIPSHNDLTSVCNLPTEGMKVVCSKAETTENEIYSYVNRACVLTVLDEPLICKQSVYGSRRSESCYCDTDLCNGSLTLPGSHHPLILLPLTCSIYWLINHIL